MNARPMRRPVIAIVAASLAAQALVWLDVGPVALHILLLLAACGWAPGWLWVEWLLGARYGDDDGARLEKVLYGLGTGYLLLITAALAVSFLPGGVAAWQLALPLNLLLLVAAGGCGGAAPRPPSPRRPSQKGKTAAARTLPGRAGAGCG